MGNPTLSIEKYDKKQLSEMRADKLALATDKFVTEMFSNLNKAKDALDALLRMKKTSKETKNWEKSVLFGEIGKARKIAMEAAEKINGYVEEQRALFRSRKVEPDLAYKWAIIPIGQTTASGTEMCVMVKRGVTLEPDYGDSDDIRVRTTLPSDKVNMAKELRRGKYNDAGFLITESACSVDRAETNLED